MIKKLTYKPTEPKVTIGIPVFNGEKFIGQAIDSLLLQSFNNFELLISDNASTDATQDICMNYLSKDNRIKYIRQKSNIGIVENFEFLLNHSFSKFFMFLACDDYLESENYLNAMINSIEDGNDFCFSNVKHRIESSKGIIFVPNIMKDFYNASSSYEFCLKTVKLCSYQLYGLYRKDKLEENFHYLTECKDFKLFAEGVFVHSMTANYKVSFVENINLVYRIHGKNESYTQNYRDLVIYFYKYTTKLIIFYYNSKFSLFKKILVIFRVFIIHSTYFLKLITKYFLSR